MDALEATRHTKRDPAIAVVWVSGSADLLAAHMSAGADGYINKPFSAHSLICRVMGLAHQWDSEV